MARTAWEKKKGSKGSVGLKGFKGGKSQRVVPLPSSPFIPHYILFLHPGTVLDTQLTILVHSVFQRGPPWGWFRGPPFRSPLQGGLKGLGAKGGGDEGLKVEGGFTFGRLQGGLKGASRGL